MWRGTGPRPTLLRDLLRGEGQALALRYMRDLLRGEGQALALRYWGMVSALGPSLYR